MEKVRITNGSAFYEKAYTDLEADYKAMHDAYSDLQEDLIALERLLNKTNSQRNLTLAFAGVSLFIMAVYILVG